MADHDVLGGSHSWERIQNGVPPEITDMAVRRLLHDYANVMTVIVDAINRLQDEDDALHKRVTHRREEHEQLRNELFKPKTGLLVVMDKEHREYTDGKTGRMTAVLLVVLGSLVTASVMLSINLGVVGK